MSESAPPGARTSPATMRNREPILQVLRRCLRSDAKVLEIASGAGEHAVFFARAMPQLRWRPTDQDAGARASIAAWRAAASLPNLEAPLPLDAADPASWPTGLVDAVVCINMIHIAPWTAAEGLMAGSGRLVGAGGQLFVYGPFLEADVLTAPSNIAFDESLRFRNPAWGLRRVDDVVALAAMQNLRLAERIAMPSNNLTLVFTRD